MTIQYQFRPIEQWPGEPTKLRKRSSFRAGWMDTLAKLGTELRALKAQNIVLQAYVGEHEIKRDGMLYAGARPRAPGVILSFDSKHGPLSYPCDRYDDWQDNVRAIALSLEALRTVDRYGVTKRAEQYKGWAKIPGPVATPPMSVGSAAALIRERSGRLDEPVNRSNFAEMYRAACLKTHPDHGGNAAEFKAVQDAKEVIDKYFA